MTSLLFRSGKYFKLRLETFVFPRVTSIHIHYQPVFSSGRNLSKGRGGRKKSSLLSKETRRTRQIPIKTPSPFPSTYTKSQKPRRRFEGSLVSKERRERENGETKVKEFGGEWGEEEERRCFERAVDATLGNRVPAVFVPIVTSPHRCT